MRVSRSDRNSTSRDELIKRGVRVEADIDVGACSIILDFVAELFGSRFNPFECGLRTMRRI